MSFEQQDQLPAVFDPTKMKLLGQPQTAKPVSEPNKAQQMLDRLKNEAASDGASSDGPVVNFLRNFWDTVNPMPLLEGAVRSMSGDMTGTMQMGSDMIQSHLNEASKAKQMWNEGRITEAVGHGLAAVTPMVGPAAAHAGEQLAAGDISGGLGTTAGLLIPFGVHPALKFADKKIVPTAARVLGDAADRRMAKVMSPTTGPNKARLSNMAASVSPEIVREPGLDAWSKAGLEKKLHSAVEATAAELDRSYDVIPTDKMVPTQPLIDALKTRLGELTVKGKAKVPGTTVKTPSVILGEDGKPIVKTQKTRGKTVPTETIPGENLPEANVLRQAIAEVEAIGKEMNVTNVRSLAQSWSKGARKVYRPDVAADAVVSKAEGLGWASAERVLRDSIVKEHPEIAPLNARYHMFKSAADAMAAAEQAERVRPGGGHKVTGAAMGAVAGYEMTGGSMIGAGLGALLGPILDEASAAGVTTKIGTARALARMSDALKARQFAKAQSALLSAAQTNRVNIPPSKLNAVFSALGRPAGEVLAETGKAVKDAVIQPRGTMVPVEGGPRPQWKVKTPDGKVRYFSNEADAIKASRPGEIGAIDWGKRGVTPSFEQDIDWTGKGAKGKINYIKGTSADGPGVFTFDIPVSGNTSFRATIKGTPTEATAKLEALKSNIDEYLDYADDKGGPGSSSKADYIDEYLRSFISDDYPGVDIDYAPAGATMDNPGGTPKKVGSAKPTASGKPLTRTSAPVEPPQYSIRVTSPNGRTTYLEDVDGGGYVSSIDAAHKFDKQSATDYLSVLKSNFAAASDGKIPRGYKFAVEQHKPVKPVSGSGKPLTRAELTMPVTDMGTPTRMRSVPVSEFGPAEPVRAKKSVAPDWTDDDTVALDITLEDSPNGPRLRVGPDSPLSQVARDILDNSDPELLPDFIADLQNPRKNPQNAATKRLVKELKTIDGMKHNLDVEPAEPSVNRSKDSGIDDLVGRKYLRATERALIQNDPDTINMPGLSAEAKETYDRKPTKIVLVPLGDKLGWDNPKGWYKGNRDGVETALRTAKTPKEAVRNLIKAGYDASIDPDHNVVGVGWGRPSEGMLAGDEFKDAAKDVWNKSKAKEFGVSVDEFLRAQKMAIRNDIHIKDVIAELKKIGPMDSYTRLDVGDTTISVDALKTWEGSKLGTVTSDGAVHTTPLEPFEGKSINDVAYGGDSTAEAWQVYGGDHNKKIAKSAPGSVNFRYNAKDGLVQWNEIPTTDQMYAVDNKVGKTLKHFINGSRGRIYITPK